MKNLRPLAADRGSADPARRQATLGLLLIASLLVLAQTAIANTPTIVCPQIRPGARQHSACC